MAAVMAPSEEASFCAMVRFGPLSPEAIERLNGMSREVIEQALRAALRANSLQELGLENGNGAQA